MNIWYTYCYRDLLCTDNNKLGMPSYEIESNEEVFCASWRRLSVVREHGLTRSCSNCVRLCLSARMVSSIKITSLKLRLKYQMGNGYRSSQDWVNNMIVAGGIQIRRTPVALHIFDSGFINSKSFFTTLCFLVICH